MKKIAVSEQGSIKKSPLPVIRRLSIYHQVLWEMKAQRIEKVSSTVLATRLEYKPIQVRKDLQLLGLVGKPKIGFVVTELLDALEKFIGWGDEHKAILFGAGNLGTALLHYPWFSEYGVRFVAAFDASPSRSNIVVNNVPVYNIGHFQKYMKHHKIEFAVVAVPANAAQEVTDVIVASGITGIWNFSAIHLRVPGSVIVENALFTQSLAVLTRRLVENRATTKG